MSPYQRFIDSLSDDEVAQIRSGEMGIACDAHDYRLVAGGVPVTGHRPNGEVREWLRESESQVLATLYAERALCHAEFDHQAGELFAQHGAALFCRHQGNQNNMALMIDEWQLIAVGPEDVRSQYGYFCEAQEALDNNAAEMRVMQWLKSGEAYNDYRSKTHCRYCQ